MILYRLFELDDEYGYDIYHGLFKDRDSMLNKACDLIEEGEPNNLLDAPRESVMRIVSSDDEKNVYYIEYDVSNYQKDSDKYGKEIYTVQGHGFEVIDTDNLI